MSGGGMTGVQIAVAQAVTMGGAAAGAGCRIYIRSADRVGVL